MTNANEVLSIKCSPYVRHSGKSSFNCLNLTRQLLLPPFSKGGNRASTMMDYLSIVGDLEFGSKVCLYFFSPKGKSHCVICSKAFSGFPSPSITSQTITISYKAGPNQLLLPLYHFHDLLSSSHSQATSRFSAFAFSP